MAKNEEEAYLDQLLKNAMMQDSKFEEDSEEDFIEDSEEENIIIDDNASVEENEFPDSQDNNLTEEILNEEEINSLNDLIKSVQEETASTDETWTDEDSESIDESQAEELNSQADIDELLSQSFSDMGPMILEDSQADFEEADNNDSSNDILDSNIYNESMNNENDSIDFEENLNNENDSVESEDNMHDEVTSQSREKDFMDNLMSIVEDSYDIKPQQPSDTEQVEIVGHSANDNGFSDALALNEFSDASYPMGDETDSTEQQNSEFNDILALDDGTSFDDIPLENDNPLSEEENESLRQMEFDNADLEDIPEKPDKKGKKKKNKKKKDKKDGKKFSLKAFFIDEEDEEVGNKDADLNQQLINELYDDTNSLDDAKVDAKEKKVKVKKEKKPKKDKPKKEKAPKKEKEPKGEKAKPNIGGIIFAIVIVAVIVATAVVGNNVFTYKRAINDANSYYSAGNYSAAFDAISGIELKNDDYLLYMKIRTVAEVFQGIESYNLFIDYADTENAIDSLIKAVGNKQNTEADAIKYEVTGECNEIYSRILNILSQYGINESKAIELFSMRNYSDYRKLLKGYKGVIDDSDN